MNQLKLVEPNGLIKIYETDKGTKVVDARELHQGLGSKQDFSDWAKSRLFECDAIENTDFTIILGKSTGGRPGKEYLLKLDIAKEMAMLERNDKGKEYRKYLIQVEEKYKSIQVDMSKLSPEMQMFKYMFDSVANQELQLKEMQETMKRVEESQQDIKDIMILESEDWRDEFNIIFNKVQKASGMSFQDLRAATYKTLETRARCDLKDRLTRAQKRMAQEGRTKTAIKNLTKLDVIEQDPKLKAIYSTIIKEFAIKYVA